MFFDKIKTRSELRTEYRRLALLHHPDHGGDVAIMQAINAEYQKLLKTLPADPVKTEKPKARATLKPATPYRRTTAGGANSHLARLANPVYSHEIICNIARTLHHYGGAASDIRTFYGKLCDAIDPGQGRPYQDYWFDRKTAQKSLRFLEKEVFRVYCNAELLGLARQARQKLAA